MKAYWIAHVNITDTQNYQKYMEAAKSVFSEYEAKLIARTDIGENLEGQAFERHVVIEFRDMETALECYQSGSYQYAKSLRNGCCEVMVTIIPIL